MNTNKLKRFAQDARKKLIEQVSAKLEFVLNTDTAALREKAVQVGALREELNRISKAQLIDKVAYTWFNRLVALRFMDVNEYQPLDIRVISPKTGYSFPEILDEAKRGHIADELKVNEQQVFDLLDGRIPSANPQNEAYKVLLIAACNHLHTILPFLFERINDYTELLLPDDLTSEFSIVHDVRIGMTEEDGQQVEIIGWLYQFYISEKKDEVFASKAKVKKEDIPAATQLFTPRWIVEYMVQNTIGKLWLQNRPASRLREHMPYFIESASLQSEDYLKINSPEELTLLDQACGSGHILVYGFELLSKIYEEEGYTPSDIPRLIIENNLFGFEIDERAAQLAAMAIMMKARSFQRRLFKKGEVPQPQILQFQDMKLDGKSLASILDACNLPVIAPRYEEVKIKLGNAHFYQLLEKAGITVTKSDWAKVPEKRKQQLETDGKVPYFLVSDLRELSSAKLESIKSKLTQIGIGYTSTGLNPLKLDNYDILILVGTSWASTLYKDLLLLQQATNLGSLMQPSTPLSEIEDAFQETEGFWHQNDAFYQFQIAELKQGIEQLRLLANKYTCVVDNPPYMGGGSMNAPLADFVKFNYPDSKADLMACFMESGLAMLKQKGFLGMINQHSWMFLSSYEVLRKKFIDITFFDTLLHLGPRTFPEIGGEVVQNASFTFWKNMLDQDGTYIRLINYDKSELKRIKTLEAIQTLDSDCYYNSNQKSFAKIPGAPIGYWVSNKILEAFGKELIGDHHEVREGVGTRNDDRFIRYSWEVSINNMGLDKKWIRTDKAGGSYKWYNQYIHLLNWERDGYEIKNYRNEDGSLKSRPQNTQFFFKPAISWAKVAAGKPVFRYRNELFGFNDAAPSMFGENLYYLIGLLNSSLIEKILEIKGGTINLTVGTIKEVPILWANKDYIDKLSLSCIEISKNYWTSLENEIEFTQNGILRVKGNDSLELVEAFDLYQLFWKNKFYQLHKQEVEINSVFLNIYGLQNELSPDVLLKDITILKEESSIENGELVFHADEVMSQFVSYAVGCMLGRYSLDKPELILAGQEETLQDFLRKVGKPVQELSFLPDADNIIPILDDEWFEDDIVSRFHQFLRVTFGDTNFSKNLSFVEECLGKDIRSYFVKEFYADHIRRYKKRPIYWMFSSPQCSFNVIIYMHRYTPDTINTILNKYLREYQEKLRTRKEHLNRVEVNGSASEKTKATKDRERIEKVLLELQEYDREILYPLATERIALDLDDGVLVNYNKFGKAIKPVPGLNDAKSKKQVKEFNWIDAAQIR